MKNFRKINNRELLNAGLKLMQANGTPLMEIPSRGRSMLYELPNGETVRIRTCNDHILIVVADSPNIEANLNIQGTDWLLIVMPEKVRSYGKVIAYFVPTSIALEEVRKSHQDWLLSNPNTKGNNTTWNLWFDDFGSVNPGREGKQGYAKKWAEYRLDFNIQIGTTNNKVEYQNIRKEVEIARQRIAGAASVPHEAVTISINFT
ncbi:MAG: hypothetical protein OXF20_11050 [Gammaproteobacteria bacterium]|nr:hypothetical protein [Gammaproteobacteria bacterium]